MSGILYTGSLLSKLIVTFLSNSTDLHAKLTELGSSAMVRVPRASFYSATIAETMDSRRLASQVDSVLSDRIKLSVPEYEKMYADGLPINGGNVTFDAANDHSRFVLLGRKADQLVYKDQQA